jgi:hypothetical protein
MSLAVSRTAADVIRAALLFGFERRAACDDDAVFDKIEKPKA